MQHSTHALQLHPDARPLSSFRKTCACPLASVTESDGVVRCGSCGAPMPANRRVDVLAEQLTIGGKP